MMTQGRVNSKFTWPWTLNIRYLVIPMRPASKAGSLKSLTALPPFCY